VCENASEVFPKGLLSGTRIANPKIFAISGQSAQEQRMKKLQSIRENVLQTQELRAGRRQFIERWGHMYKYPSGEDDSNVEMSDRQLAKRLKALQANGQTRAEDSSDSSSSDEADIDFKTWRAKETTEKESSRPSVKNLGLAPQDFEGCDLDILDGLDIKDWKRGKKKLEAWGIGKQSPRVDRVPIRGMTLELRQWVMIVQAFSSCSLTFSKDKLVAISGLADLLEKGMACEYLAGLWRKDLEHQMLWKATRPSPAPRKDGMRGPSWSWASIDGSIEIPDWSGYFGTMWVSRES
jgi:hypothetical protein